MAGRGRIILPLPIRRILGAFRGQLGDFKPRYQKEVIKMLKGRKISVADYGEKITFEELNKTIKFLETYQKMLVIQNKVIYDYVSKCHSAGLFALTRNLHLLNNKKMEVIQDALIKTNNLIFKLLDFGAIPVNGKGGKK